MKIGIIGGAGNVGAATAFNLVSTNVAREVILLDVAQAKAEAEVYDILHATSNKIRFGDTKDLEGADIIIVSAGLNQKPGETRLDLLDKNLNIFKQIIPPAAKSAPNAIFLIATNPCDIMTEITLRLTGFPPSRVFGTGTLLDSKRFKSELSSTLGVSVDSISAYVVGEHGDSSVCAFSSVRVGMSSLKSFCEVNSKTVDENMTSESVRKVAYKIIQSKGATSFGIAGSMTHICRAILMDSKEILPLSVHHDSFGAAKNFCFSVPVIIGRTGIIQVLEPEVSECERKKLEESAKILTEFVQKIEHEISK